MSQLKEGGQGRSGREVNILQSERITLWGTPGGVSSQHQRSKAGGYRAYVGTAKTQV